MKPHAARFWSALTLTWLAWSCSGSDERAEQVRSPATAAPNSGGTGNRAEEDGNREPVFDDFNFEDTDAPVSEDFDLDDTDTADSNSAPVQTTLATKRIFITAASFHGDLRGQGGGLDGLDGADRICAAAANAAALDGAWLGWVSTSNVDALSRLRTDARWTLLDGVTEVFPSTDAIQLGPRHAIDVSETGVTLNAASGASLDVWTNTDRLGRNSSTGESDACADWTSQAGVAAVGVVFNPALPARAGLSWTDTGLPQGCGASHHLYCFEN
jgi:hypothetical protein